MFSRGTTVNSSPLPHRLCQVNPRDGDTCPTRGRLPSPSPTSRIFGATSRYSSSWVAFGEMNDLSPFRAPSTSWFLALLLLFPPGQTSKTSRWLPRLAGRLPVDAHISPFLFFPPSPALPPHRTALFRKRPRLAGDQVIARKFTPVLAYPANNGVGVRAPVRNARAWLLLKC